MTTFVGGRLKGSALIIRLLATFILTTIIYQVIVVPFRNQGTTTYDKASVTISDVKEAQPKLDLLSTNIECEKSALADRVLVIVKTGASEAHAKIPTQLLTTLRCVPNLLYVSDMEQDIAGHHLHDVLTHVTESIRETHSDFDLYRQQRTLVQEGVEFQLQNLIERRFYSGKPARTLDKYKYFHMLDTVWAQHPDKDYYFFIETDTYVVWPTFLKWLETIDATKELLIGSPTYLSEFAFDDRYVQGGAGFLMTQPALRKFTIDHPGMAPKLDVRMRGTSYGDFLFSTIAQDYGLAIDGAWPMFNKESMWTVPYGPTAWCEPIITLGNMSPFDQNMFWNYMTHNRTSPSPIRLRDLYVDIILPNLPDKRDDWSLSCPGIIYDIDDIRADMGRKSFDTCRDACSKFDDCFQFTYLDGATCVLHRCFSAGRPAQPDNRKHWHGGWMNWRILDWVEQQGTCNGTEWVGYSTDNWIRPGSVDADPESSYQGAYWTGEDDAG